jgi:DNA (cytosine-5)-methyltransferase 1
VFENVRGLLRASFSKYFEYILLQLTYPNIIKKRSEDWQIHLSRLEKYHTRGKYTDHYYRVVFRLVNAANYGVPQHRHRVFIVGFRNDLNKQWSFPPETHSEENLFYSKWISGQYWEEHKISRRKKPKISPEIKKRADQIKVDLGLAPQPLKRWLTVRDAIAGLPDPKSKNFIPNHQFRPGAKAYAGHTGSQLDEPSKALKAGDHGVPGGENMVVLDNGELRYFTARESARIQTFPDEYLFDGSWTECMRQIGNAVPVKLAETVSESIYHHLN